jgi:hypothetical protein
MLKFSIKAVIVIDIFYVYINIYVYIIQTGGNLSVMLKSSIKAVIVIVVVGLGGNYIWENRRMVIHLFKSFFKKSRKESLQGIYIYIYYNICLFLYAYII